MLAERPARDCIRLFCLNQSMCEGWIVELVFSGKDGTCVARAKHASTCGVRALIHYCTSPTEMTNIFGQVMHNAMYATMNVQLAYLLRVSSYKPFALANLPYNTD